MSCNISVMPLGGEQSIPTQVWKLTQEKAKKPAFVAAAKEVLGA